MTDDGGLAARQPVLVPKRRRGRELVIALVLVLIAILTGLVWQLTRGLPPPVPDHVGRASLDVASWASHKDPKAGWSLRYPSRWHLQLVEPEGFCQGDAIVVMNFDADLSHPYLGPSSCTGLWDMRSLPRNFVVVEIEVPLDVPPAPQTSQRTTPLSLADARPGSRAARFGVPAGVFIPFYLDQRHQFVVRLWHGDGAGARDREIANRIVTSIRFGLSAD